MEVKRICQWCGKPFIAQKTTTCYCSPQCSKRGYKHRMMERKMELRHMQEMLELRSSLEKQEYFTFSQAARLMGVSRQYIYKLVKEEKLRASRLSGKMSLIRKADIELMLKSKPYERLVAKNDFDITEYYTAEEIAQENNRHPAKMHRNNTAVVFFSRHIWSFPTFFRNLTDRTAPDIRHSGNRFGRLCLNLKNRDNR